MRDDGADDEEDARPTQRRMERPRVRAISMKTPSAIAPEKAARPKPEVKLAAPPTTAVPAPRGRLAPPRDTRELRVRRAHDAVVRTSVAVIVAAIVALVIWLIAGR